MRSYRSLDLLLIGALQFLATRWQAQAALQSIFDALHSRHRQMLFTTDVHPWEMQGFGDSLKSRLGSGLRCAIDLPDIEMRRTMVYQEARNLGLEIDPQAADSIARLVRSNARAVKVAVRRLFAYSRFHQIPVSPGVVEAALPKGFL